MNRKFKLVTMLLWSGILVLTGCKKKIEVEPAMGDSTVYPGFYVGNNTTVEFAKGNLQYRHHENPDSIVWRFAEKQYDIVNQTNSNINECYKDWVDLFAWGSSGYSDIINVSESFEDFATGQKVASKYASSPYRLFTTKSNSPGGDEDAIVYKNKTVINNDSVINNNSMLVTKGNNVAYVFERVLGMMEMDYLEFDYNLYLSYENKYPIDSVFVSEIPTLVSVDTIYKAVDSTLVDTTWYYVYDYVYDSVFEYTYIYNPTAWEHISAGLLDFSHNLLTNSGNAEIRLAFNYNPENNSLDNGKCYLSFYDKNNNVYVNEKSFDCSYDKWINIKMYVGPDENDVNSDYIAKLYVDNEEIYKWDSWSTNSLGEDVGKRLAVAYFSVPTLAANSYNVTPEAYIDDVNWMFKFTYNPWNYNHTGNSSLYGPWGVKNLTGDYAKADWGMYNAIGSAPAGTWRTLSYEEWNHLLFKRYNAAGLRSQGTIVADGQEIHGLIILPGDWVTPSGVSFKGDTNDYTTNVYTISEWDSMESAGAVFLPAAGYRDGTTVNHLNYSGVYWSSTCKDYNKAYSAQFHYDGLNTAYDQHYRYAGASVRLVKNK